MRTLALLVLLTSGCAHAGPSVSRSIVESLPAGVQSQAAPLRAQITQLEAAIEAKDMGEDREEGNVKALKFEVKAAKAQVKADKAALKAARKRDDSSAVAVARAAMEASKATYDELERRYAVSGALAELLDVQGDLLEEQLELKEAELQIVYAVGANSSMSEGYDDSKYRKARAKAERSFQKARADVSQAETRFLSAGGETVPDRMTISDATTAPAMGGSDPTPGMSPTP